MLRRLAAIAYDLLLLLAVLFVATAAALPLNSGVAFTSKQFLYPIFLTVVSFLFFGWFWTHGGQTLGLRAWKLKVLSYDRQPISWTQSTLRFLFALFSWVCFGLGFLWILFDKDKRGWHDHLSKSAVFFESTPPDLPP